MFTWDKTIEKIDASADQVLNLFRSMRDVQLALPGQSVQEASAYLCQVRSDTAAATYAVFHLHKSGQLAFYVSDPRQVPENKADLMLDKGLNFVESMGFLLTDMDLNLLSEQDREMLWNSLPLAAGAPSAAERERPPEEKPAPVGTPVEEPPAKASPPVPAEPNEPAPETPAEAAPTSDPTPAPAPEPAPLPADKAVQEEDSVDDLLAAVEALRAKRPGLQPRRKAPKPAEIRKRRDELRQTIGRLLASL